MNFCRLKPPPGVVWFVNYPDIWSIQKHDIQLCPIQITSYPCRCKFSFILLGYIGFFAKNFLVLKAWLSIFERSSSKPPGTCFGELK